MKSFTEELVFQTSKRFEFIDITDRVERAVEASGVADGFCLVNAMHITASVFINDAESGLHADFLEWLEKMAPHEPVSRYVTMSERTTPTPTSRGRYSVARWSSRSPRLASISGPGSGYSTGSSTAGDGSASW